MFSNSSSMPVTKPIASPLPITKKDAKKPHLKPSTQRVGEYPKVLEKWNSGRTLIFVDDQNLEKENYLAAVKGDVEIKKWKDNSFRPLIGLSKEKINELTQRIKN